MALITNTVSGSFSGTGASDSIIIRGSCNITLFFGGAVGTVVLEKSFDNGVTWYVVSKNTTPDPASFTDNVNAVIEDHEPNVQYRWNCTVFTSGAIVYRIGKAYADRRGLL